MTGTGQCLSIGLVWIALTCYEECVSKLSADTETGDVTFNLLTIQMQMDSLIGQSLADGNKITHDLKL